MIKQIGILLITRMITDRIGLHSVLLPLLIIISIIIIITIITCNNLEGLLEAMTIK